MQRRVTARTTSLFAHAPFPLENTLDYRGDPGLFGPDSMTWSVLGDVASFIGGIRALLIQAAHPEVAAGVADHSRYRQDPLGRLSRTSAYVTATAFGAMPEVEHAVSLVRRAHRPVTGTSARGRTYSAADPALAAWVHNALTESFMASHASFGPGPMADHEADQFVAEQTKVGELLGARPLPTTASGLTTWMAFHPEAAWTEATAQALAFLMDPPLPRSVLLPYRVMVQAAVATIHPRLLDILRLQPRRGALAAGRAAVSALRWSLGSSPSWQLALVRVGADVPEGLFRTDHETYLSSRNEQTSSAA